VNSRPEQGRSFFNRLSISFRSVELVALFLLIVLGRGLAVAAYAESVPFWDQWDAEGASLLKPWVEGTFRFTDLFGAHNEHRFAYTRLLVLALFVANRGQWDNLVMAHANVSIYALFLLFCYWRLSKGFSGFAARGALFVGTVLVAWLPFGW